MQKVLAQCWIHSEHQGVFITVSHCYSPAQPSPVGLLLTEDSALSDQEDLEALHHNHHQA
jgi:hypothetical protein